MKKSITISLICLGLLSACQSVPTEYKSPCACDYERINPIVEDGKALT